MDMTEKNQAFEQEVNLRDYVSIIMKRKVSVLAVLFAFVIFAAAMGFCTPKTREISMLIEPAVVGVNDSGAYAYVESTPSIKARIDAGAFDLKILRLLGLDPQITRLKFVTYQPKDSILLRLSVIDPEKGEKLGARVLNQPVVELTD
jgi:LPS O-antigen subunit length determinant protein (WzzB/FepE family)